MDWKWVLEFFAESILSQPKVDGLTLYRVSLSTRYLYKLIRSSKFHAVWRQKCFEENIYDNIPDYPLEFYDSTLEVQRSDDLNEFKKFQSCFMDLWIETAKSELRAIERGNFTKANVYKSFKDYYAPVLSSDDESDDEFFPKDAESEDQMDISYRFSLLLRS